MLLDPAKRRQMTDQFLAKTHQNDGGILGRALRCLRSEPWLWRLVFPIALVAAFYGEENWRGKAAWERCKREMKSKGAVLDWAAYIPAEVPADQNFFNASYMTEWFGWRNRSPLSRRLSTVGFWEFLMSRDAGVLADVTVIAADASVARGEADCRLRYVGPGLMSALDSEPPLASSGPRPAVIPLIIMEYVPLQDAIRTLAKAAGVNYVLDPKVYFAGTRSSGQSASQPTVSVRWENVTALQALIAVLNNYQLRLIDDPKTGIARITNKDAFAPDVYLSPLARERMVRLIKNAIEAGTNGSVGEFTEGVEGFTLHARPLNPSKPAHVVVRADTPPGKEGVAGFFPKIHSANGSAVRVESSGSNSFRVFLSPLPYAAAADYLDWSDQFEPEFDDIRKALERPYSRIPGEYRQPFLMPMPNFVTVRVVAQTLAQRAQCYLLLGRPERALNELTLMHDLCRLLETKPSGKPNNLIAAMIHVALTGLYVNVVADGMRLQAWREPQLRALQAQLERVDLPTRLLESVRAERAGTCTALETASGAELAKLVSPLGTGTSFWDNLKEPVYLLATLGPRGWIWQNMAAVARLDQLCIDGFDVTHRTVVPHLVDRASSARQDTFSCSPHVTLLARNVAPDYLRACQFTARNQTLVNEALIACALDRYRLAHSRYPETLGELVPQFADKLPQDIIGGQALHYRCEQDGRFLLYSVGWNESDDGGVTVRQAGGAVDVAKGDWVWQFPLN